MPGVRQDNCRADAFGLKAEVLKQNMSALTLSMQQVKKDGSFQNFIYECEVEDVVPWNEDQMPAMKMKSFSTVTNGEKRFMVKQIWGNDLGDTDSSRNGEMLADTDLTAIFEYLQFQYQQPKVAMATPSAVKLACVEGASTPEGAACILDIKAIMKTSTHVVIPVHAEMPKHWTAILLEMETLGSIKVKRAYYFDWLKPLQVRNRNYARKILRLLTLENDLSYMQLAAPHNKYVQRIGSNDCGFVVWYAMEVAMKQQRLEGSWNLMPRPDLWRATLNTALKNLLKEQQKWILEDLTPKKKNWIPAFEIVLPGQKHPDKEKMIEELHKKFFAGELKYKAEDFYTCASCRWSSSGFGCFNCSPVKKAEVQAAREKEVKQLSNALLQWQKELEESGAFHQEMPADVPYAESQEKLTGGGILEDRGSGRGPS